MPLRLCEPTCAQFCKATPALNLCNSVSRCDPHHAHPRVSAPQEQLSLAKNARLAGGLYVGLRLDGRVRASGMGCPPWGRFAAELAPLEGESSWKGLFDGFDGKV